MLFFFKINQFEYQCPKVLGTIKFSRCHPNARRASDNMSTLNGIGTTIHLVKDPAALVMSLCAWGVWEILAAPIAAVVP